MWLARLFVVSPMVVVYFFHETHMGPLKDHVGALQWFGVTAAMYAGLCLWDLTRKPPRTKISVMLSRMLIASMACCFIFKLFGASWFFWYILSHGVVWMLVGLQLVVHRFGHHFIYPDADETYLPLRQRGWHPYWDQLPFMFNPDSQLVRNGDGFQEPAYTGLVPPRSWQYQCPNCGARVQHQVDVCWRCNYGADGRSDAYYQRWGGT